MWNGEWGMNVEILRISMIIWLQIIVLSEYCQVLIHQIRQDLFRHSPFPIPNSQFSRSPSNANLAAQLNSYQRGMNP